EKAFRLGYGRLEERAAGGSDIDGVEVAAVLHLGDVGEAEPFEMELGVLLHVECIDLERAVMGHAFSVGPRPLGGVRLDAKVDDGAAAAGADLVPNGGALFFSSLP